MGANHLERGQRGEALACSWLEKKGYEILERNVRYKFGEIDIVARIGKVLCFVEVRSRQMSTYGSPMATVNFEKQKKIVRAAGAYLQKLKTFHPLCRFDVVSIVGEHGQEKLTHIPNAFDASFDLMGRQRRSPWVAY